MFAPVNPSMLPVRSLLLAISFFLPAGLVLGYAPGGRWSATASNLTTGGVGSAATLTWSIAPDGTWIAKDQASSKLVSLLDAVWGAGPGGSDYTKRPWFPVVNSAFERWGTLGGVTFRYEPADDGLEINNAPAELGVRGDIRLSGTYLDGPLGTLAYNEFPGSGGDMVLDTSDRSYFGNSSNYYRRFRNNLMHELGHAMGLAHVRSSDANFLLEPLANVSYDGPQLDDILGLHHLYGDVTESLNNGVGNNTLENATHLGQLRPGDTRTYGADSLTGPVVEDTAIRFLSISNQNDKDVFSFTVDRPVSIDLLLLQGGAEYTLNDSPADSTSNSNLSLELLDAGGGLVAVVDQAALGQAEHHRNIGLVSPGEYFVRVSGDQFLAQFYALHLGVNSFANSIPLGDYNFDGKVDLLDHTIWRDQLGSSGQSLSADGSNNGQVTTFDRALWQGNFNAGLLTTLPGDFNLDGVVDMQDFAVWRDSLGTVGFDLPADGDRDYHVSEADYDLWQANFGRVLGGSGQLGLATVPEPSAAWLLTTAGVLLCLVRGLTEAASTLVSN